MTHPSPYRVKCYCPSPSWGRADGNVLLQKEIHVCEKIPYSTQVSFPTEGKLQKRSSIVSFYLMFKSPISIGSFGHLIIRCWDLQDEMWRARDGYHGIQRRTTKEMGFSSPKKVQSSQGKWTALWPIKLCLPDTFDFLCIFCACTRLFCSGRLRQKCNFQCTRSCIYFVGEPQRWHSPSTWDEFQCRFDAVIILTLWVT